MHSLTVLKNACLAAIDDDEESRDPTMFRDVVDPESVLALIAIAEGALSKEECAALGDLIRDLASYVAMVPDDKDIAHGLDRGELTRRARQLRGVTGI